MPRLTKDASKEEKRERTEEEMHKFKKGKLRSSNGKKVTSRKQAIAIALSESGQSRKDKHGKMAGHKRHYKGRKKRGAKR